MSKQKQCLFQESWIGQCEELQFGDSLCCEKHSKEKCQVCGEQATTRCQASIGLMCGMPLCHLCGEGQMCLHHACTGPLMVIRALLGGGPVASVLTTGEVLEKERRKMLQIVERLRKRTFPTQLATPIAEQVR